MKTLLFAVALAIAACSHAQPCIDYGDYLHQSGFHDLLTENITVAGDRLYATTPIGLRCYDVSDPGSLVLLGSVAVPPGAGAIAAAGSLAHVVSGQIGFDEFWLSVVDATDPTALQVLGTVELPSAAMDVAVSGDRVLVACIDSGIVVVDIADPTAPQDLGTIPLSVAFGVATAGSWGFATAAGGLHVLDLATPGLPEVVGSLTIPGGAAAVAMAGMTAHVAGGQGVHVVDCSEPWQPALLGNVAIHVTDPRIVVSDDIAYVAVRDRGLKTIDVSDPWAPRLIGGVLSARFARDVAVAGATIYLACYDQFPAESEGPGIMVIDGSNPANPPAVGSLDLGAVAHDLCVVDQWAYVLGDHDQDPVDVLRVIDVSQPQQPQPSDSFILQDGAAQLAAAPPYLIVGYGDGNLVILDVSDPSQIAQRSEIQLSAELNVVVAAGSHAYAGVGYYLWGAIHGVDLTDPKAPEIFYSTSFGRSDAMGTDGTRMVVAGLHGEISPDFILATFDVSNPPDVHGCGMIYLDEEFPGDLAVAGNLAVMTGARGTYEWSWPHIRYVDLSDLGSPQLRGSSHLARPAGSVALADAVAYVGIGADGYGGLQVFSAADLDQARSLGGTETPGSLRALTVRDHLIYGLVSPSTLVILPAQCGETTAVADRGVGSPGMTLRLRIQPNPCNPRASISFRLTAPARVAVDVYDVSGAAVAVLAGRVFPSGEHTLVWDGKDAGGRNVASGVYCVRVRAGRVTATETLVLVR